MDVLGNAEVVHLRLVAGPFLMSRHRCWGVGSQAAEDVVDEEDFEFRYRRLRPQLKVEVARPVALCHQGQDPASVRSSLISSLVAWYT